MKKRAFLKPFSEGIVLQPQNRLREKKIAFGLTEKFYLPRAGLFLKDFKNKSFFKTRLTIDIHVIQASTRNHIVIRLSNFSNNVILP